MTEIAALGIESIDALAALDPATLHPDGSPLGARWSRMLWTVLWISYAYHGYLLLQRVDERLLEPYLPPAIFYNLLLTARKPN